MKASAVRSWRALGILGLCATGCGGPAVADDARVSPQTPPLSRLTAVDRTHSNPLNRMRVMRSALVWA